MTTIRSQIDTQSPAFCDNLAHTQQSLAALEAIEESQQAQATRYREKFPERQQLLPQQRLLQLLDPGSPFIPLCPYAGFGMFEDKQGESCGGGCIAGIGQIQGKACVIRVDNYVIKGGTITPIGMEKALRLQDIALQQKLPLITLAQSGGANLHYAGATFVPGGRAFANQARLSAAGIPQITVVHGSATAGGAYQPGLSDYVIMVKQQAYMYLAGPPLLKAATGEVADDETLGGAHMHCAEAGTSEYLAEDDAQAIALARAIMAQLPQSELPPLDDGQPPLYPNSEMTGLVPKDPKQGLDMHEVIARLVDNSAFLAFKSQFDAYTLCGHSKLYGNHVGIIANNGPITSKGATKAAQFIQLCQQSSIPLLFLHNTPGFLVGTQAEHSGIIKHGSKLIQAVANARVPKLSLVVGGSYGAGNYAMCGRGFDPDFIFAWPNARTSVMGPAQAADVLRLVTQAKQARQGESNPQQVEALATQTEQHMERESRALSCSAKLWDDGIINPEHTRWVLGYLLHISVHAKKHTPAGNDFGVARF